MDKRRDVIITVALAAVAAAALVCACGDGPQLAEPTAWAKVATFPEDATAINGLTSAEVDAIYAVGSRTPNGEGWPHPVVYRFDGTRVSEAYLSPYDGKFSGADAYGGEVIAAGNKHTSPNHTRPYVVRYSGAAWEEITVPSSINEISFLRVYVGSGGRYWFQGREGVYIYSDGVWTTALVINDPYLAVTTNGRAFVFKPNHYGTGGDVYVSDDAGRSWRSENVQLEDSSFYSPDSFNPIVVASAGEGFALRSDFKANVNEEIIYSGVIARDDAPAGEGTYNIAFSAPHGPNFYDIMAMAFASASDGYCVGNLTSVKLDDGVWVQEDLLTMSDIMFSGVTAGPSRYWSVGSPGSHRYPIILFEATR